MSEQNASSSEVADAAPAKARWFVRKRDGSVFGPETIEVLLEWAAQCRLVSGNEVSTDRINWVPAESLPELQMHWKAILPDGRTFGPFNVLATAELHGHNVVTDDTQLVNTLTRETVLVRDRLAAASGPRQEELFGGAAAERGGAGEAERAKSRRTRRKTTEKNGEPDVAVGSPRSAAEEAAAPAPAAVNEDGGASAVTSAERAAPAETASPQADETPADAPPAAGVQATEREPAVAPAPAEAPESPAVPVANVVTPPVPEGVETASVQAVPETVSAAAAEAAEARAERVRLEKRERKLTAQLAKLAEELVAERERAENAELLAQERAAAAEAARAGAPEAEATLAALTRQVRELKVELDATRTHLESARAALAERETEVNDLKAELRAGPEADEARLREWVADVEAERERSHARVREMQARLEQMRQQLTQTEQALGEERSRLQEQVEHVRKAEANAGGLDARTRNLRADVEQRVTRARREVQDAQAALGTAQRRALGFAVLAALCAAVAIVCGVWAGRQALRAGAGEAESTPPPETPAARSGVAAAPAAPAATGRTASPGRTVAPVAPPSRAGAAATTARRTPPVIRVPGVLPRLGGNVCTLTFESPAFSSMTTLSSEAKQQLLQIASQVRDYMPGFTLTIRGHTDNSPVRHPQYADNLQLGLARAKVVYEFLRVEGRLPPAAMQVVSAGATNPPYPNDTPAGREKNRTVVLLLMRNR